MNNLSNKKLIILVVVILFGAIITYWFFGFQNNKTPIIDLSLPAVPNLSDTNTSSSVPVSSLVTDGIDGLKILSIGLSRSSSLEYPGDWQMKKVSDNLENFEFAVNDGRLLMQLFDVEEWLRGPALGEGYVLNNSKRKELIGVMNELYSAGKLTDEIKQKLNNFHLEFLTYSAKDRVYVDYLESNDHKARGLSMIGTRGQDIGLMTEYVAILFNPEQDAILSIKTWVGGGELDELVKRYGDYSSPNIRQIDDEVHRAFVELINDTSRNELSFSKAMDVVNKVVISWKF